MIFRTVTRGQWLAAALCALLPTSLVLFQLPGEGRFSQALQNAGHGLGFALLAFCSLRAMEPGTAFRELLSSWFAAPSPSPRSRLGRRLPLIPLALFVMLFALGLVVEGLQQLGGRSASLADLFMNLLGMTAGGALYVAWRQMRPSSRRRDPASASAAAAIAPPVAGPRLPVDATRADGRREEESDTRLAGRPRRLVRGVTAAFVATAALIWCLRLPLGILVVDALAPALPSLATFEQPFALAKFSDGQTSAALTLVEAHPLWLANRTRVLEATFPPGQWPGFRLIEPPADWRGHDTLAMSVMNPSQRVVRLYVRVDERAPGKDIFRTSAVDIRPGANPVRIDLHAMRPDVDLDERPGHEPFAEVSQILLFLSDNRDGVTLLFDAFRLK